MKTILFFSRCDLIEFYASLSLKMKNEFNIIHVVYSDKEKEILKNKYGINANYVFQDLIKSRLNEKLNEKLIIEIDSLIITYTKSRFTLNSSIQSDRGFSLLTYNEALLLAQAQYLVWNEIFKTNKIDFFYHEPPSLFMNHIASLLCLSNNAKYCYDSMIRSENENNFILLMQDTAFSPSIINELSRINENDVALNMNRINQFLIEFRNSYNVYFGDKLKSNIKYISLLKMSLKTVFKNKLYKRKYCKLRDNIDYYLINRNDSWNNLSNILNYKLKIKFDHFNNENKYYYYSMNLEPEATVLYLGDGLYVNQIQLIINIAAQLPPKTYLYVKDHPHFIGYRNYLDYKRLKKVPNIKILKSEIPGKKVIKDCIGVFIINGTAGFEGIILNKQIYTFGNMFFNIYERVNYVKNIKDLRVMLYDNLKVKYEDDYNFYKFILAFLNSTPEGVTDYFQGRISLYDIDHELNVTRIAEYLSDFFLNYNSNKIN